VEPSSSSSSSSSSSEGSGDDRPSSISQHVLQQLNTTRLDDEALVTTPVITGAQVLDGEVRLFFFEGPYDDALQVLFGMCHDITSTGAGLALWDVDRVYHGDRVLGALGVHVEPIKLRAPLAKLVGEAGTFSTGKVRDMAREGVLRLLFFQRALFGVEVEKTTTTEYHTWVAVGSTYFRHVDDFRLFPTDAMSSSLQGSGYGGGREPKTPGGGILECGLWVGEDKRLGCRYPRKRAPEDPLKP
jgi:hypothetical protein